MANEAVLVRKTLQIDARLEDELAALAEAIYESDPLQRARGRLQFSDVVRLVLEFGLPPARERYAGKAAA